MKITNKHCLPEPLVQAITWDLRKREGFSVTDLINPPRITQLQRRHWDELEEDASDRIWVLLGSAIHYVLAKSDIPDSRKEQQLKIEIDGIEITGRPDLCHNGSKDDYKITSVWNIVYEPNGREEWHSQLNLYNYLDYQATGEFAEKLQVCAILRDWQQSKVGEHNYPTFPVAIINIPVWPVEKTESYLKERIKLHLEAEKLPDEELPFCTPDDTWEKPTTYAVMKRGRQSAIRVFPTLQEAKKLMGAGLYLEVRKGKRTRCASYCEVNRFCNQFADYRKGLRVNKRQLVSSFSLGRGRVGVCTLALPNKE